jgi:hypothetical protein
MWANSKGSLPQGNNQPVSCQINSSCGSMGGGGAFSLFDTQRKLKKLGLEHTIAWHFRHEGFVKTKLFDHICKKCFAKNHENIPVHSENRS